MELGYPNAKGLWSALYAPAATPRDVLEIVREAAVQALASEQVTTAFRQQMIRAVPSASLADAQAWNKAEVAYWKKVTDEVKIDLPD
jgi:tripartite-type tricarboxylate transporter receptor subunit TctC